MVVVMVMMVQSGGRAGFLVMVVQAKHEAGRGGVPVMVARRRVQLAAPRGHRVQLAAAVATAVTAVTDVTDIADDATTQRAQRWLPRGRDRGVGVGVAAGRAARPVAGAGHRPSVFFRRHHRDAFRAHRRPVRVRQLACALCPVGWRCFAYARVAYASIVNVAVEGACRSRPVSEWWSSRDILSRFDAGNGRTWRDGRKKSKIYKE